MATVPTTTDRERGQALTEFTLIASLLLVIVLSIFQFGATLSDYIDVTDSARAAARKAATYGAGDTYDSTIEATARTQARQAAFDSATVAGMAVTLTATPSWTAGQTVKATVTAPYSINILGLTVTSGQLTSSTTMRIERRPR